MDSEERKEAREEGVGVELSSASRPGGLNGEPIAVDDGVAPAVVGAKKAEGVGCGAPR